MRDAPLVLALLLSISACARETGLPEAPPPEEVRPIFLGELSGVYALDAALEGLYTDQLAAVAGFDDYRVHVPLHGQLVVLHLGAVAEGPQPMGAILQLAQPEEDLRVASDTPPRPETTTDLFQGLRYYLGDVGETDIVRVRGDGPEVLASKVAGSSRLDLHLVEYRVCEGGPAYDLSARRVCPFDPALSGVYVGSSLACDGSVVRSDETVAVGFYGSVFIGMRHPEVERVFNGLYDRVAQAGFAFAGTFEDRELFGAGEGLPPDSGEFTLDEGGGVIALEIDVEATVGGECVERLELRRLSGGESSSCSLTEARAGGLEVGLRRAEEAGRRFLDVAVHPAGQWSVVLPQEDLAVEVLVRPAAGGAVLRPEPDAPPGFTRRFELPATAAGARYEVLARRLEDLFNLEAIYASPRCAADL